VLETPVLMERLLEILRPSARTVAEAPEQRASAHATPERKPGRANGNVRTTRKSVKQK